MQDLSVKSVVIDYTDKTLEIVDVKGEKHTLPFSKEIEVTMVGYPSREIKTMSAKTLGMYMKNGYIIERIKYDE